MAIVENDSTEHLPPIPCAGTVSHNYRCQSSNSVASLLINMQPNATRRFMKSSFLKLLLILIAILSISVWRETIIWQRPKHLTEIARAHGYVGLLFGVPQVNADGSKIVYSQMDDWGIGVFLLDLTSGHKTLVHEKVSADDWFQNVDAWPWSPDGKYFLYTHTNLFVCDGVTGRAINALPVDGLNGVASLVWLNQTSFVYVSRTGNLHEIEEREDHIWREVQGLEIKTGANNLTAISKNEICWQSRNYIWRLNLSDGVATVLFHAQTNRLEGFNYSTKTKFFLVNCLNSVGSSIQQMFIDNGRLENYWSIGVVPSAHEVQPLSDKSQCAYIASDAEQSDDRHLELLSRSSTKPLKLFTNGNVDGLDASGDGKKLFIVGAVSNEPAPSIWEYSTTSGELLCLVPGLDHPSPYAIRVPSHEFTVNLNGEIFNYHVYEPVGLNPNAHKKYPVLIGDTLFKVLDPAYENRVHGPYWAPMLANAGAYVVIVERPGSWGNQMERWPDYVDWVYKKMMENPTIDPSQVYLYATSAETMQLSNYVQNYPQPWNGLILLSPAALPDLRALSKLRLPPKILISQGLLEGTNRIYQYQIEALRGGTRVEYYTHENNAHILLGKKAMGERAEAMMKFVFGD